ncbi:hypothetical protein E1B28_008894 [Marasmius oreades]|uniref:RING-type domain-containing protein n=1 Tax=Marasmius oreades TaxID=181124 RepID=A0A9P7RZ87_9AGAR|nr:uncharacterized protein E1B28_008894 [Marasmius oreades]KAG7092544.1 hypothetical protein E1B28_008894 [Marasmius oreades]
MATAPTEFDFWQFVSCAKCQLTFLSGPDTVANVPFWLTECGHVICNNHLKSDRSCAQCGAQGIQFLPLQREMDPPMSDWFRSVPHMLDAAAYATKFQQEAMAAQIRILKARHHQQRLYIDKLKREIVELQRMNELLQRQFHPDYAHSGLVEYGEEPSSFVNPNGKRSMGSSVKDNRSSTTSSPRRMTTPVGMNRLTLPLGQRPPHLSSKQGDLRDLSDTNDSQQRKPGSSRFQQEYSYDPSPKQSSGIRGHATSRRGKSGKHFNMLSGQRQQSSQQMPPPPAPCAALATQCSVVPRGNLSSTGTSFSQRFSPFVSSKITPLSRTPSILPTNRLLEPSSSRVPSRANAMLTGGGQRTPFVPKC